MKKVLMIAYHYPPCQGGSGIERTLRFSQYLPANGWKPIILSPHPRVYERVDTAEGSGVPSNILVKRSFAIDAAKHLSVNGRYFKSLAIPDRWISWWFSAVPAGIKMIREHHPDVIWSTYPIPTAHLIGLTLHNLTGIPWVADFRDPMVQENWPGGILNTKVWNWLERMTVKKCSKAVFTTAGTLRLYEGRYPDIPKSRWVVIANGYEEDDFVGKESSANIKETTCAPLTLVHSGHMYLYERNPNAFFSALSDLWRKEMVSPANLKIVFRASGNEEIYGKIVKENNLEDLVFFEPWVSHREAVKETLNADGLLIFQGSDCNRQIPAKIYDYLRAKRPIFAMTDMQGDTARLLMEMGINTIVPLDSKEKIMQGLTNFLKQVREGTAPIARDEEIKKYTRKAETLELSNLLEDVTR